MSDNSEEYNVSETSETSETLNTEDVINECDIINFMANIKKIEITTTEKNKRISKNHMTKYELVRIVGERTAQLTRGAKPLIKINKLSDELSYKEIAIEELKQNMTPLKIKRLVGNSYEIWNIDELQKEHLMNIF
jgi:DNA-directed RNA polymerase subunit K/omega